MGRLLAVLTIVEARWCGHTGRYQVIAHLCGNHGYSDQIVRCEECKQKFMASQLARWGTGYVHQPKPRTWLAGSASTARTGADEAQGISKERRMSVPARTGNPEARQQAQAKDQDDRKDLGDGWLSGNLATDPELRYTPTGRAVCKLRVAHTPRLKDPDNGKWYDGDTVFYNVAVWGYAGENCVETLQKGDRVVAGGQWYEHTWETLEGEQRTATEMSARDIGPSLLFLTATIKRTRRGKEN